MKHISASPFKCMGQESGENRYRRNKWMRGDKWEKGGLKGTYGEKERSGVCVRQGGTEEEEGQSWWGVEVRATEWHSVSCGLIKVLIMELVTFQPVTDPVSVIDPPWSVTRRHYWSGQRPRSATWTSMHNELLSPHLRRAEPPAEIPPAPAAQGPRVSLLRALQLIAPINGMIEMEGQSLKTMFQSIKHQEGQWLLQ